MIFHVPLNTSVLLVSTVTYECYLTSLSAVVIISVVQFNIGSLYILLTKYIYVFHKILKRKFSLICTQK